MRAADGVTFFATEKKTNYSPSTSSERSGVIKRRKSDGRRSRRERGGEAGGRVPLSDQPGRLLGVDGGGRARVRVTCVGLLQLQAYSTVSLRTP